MDINEIILDHKCLSQGLPPLSMGSRAALQMIKKLPPEQKRKVMRKLRKLARREISKRSRESGCPEQQIRRRDFLEVKSNLTKHRKQDHRGIFVETRLSLVRSLFLRNLQGKND